MAHTQTHTCTWLTINTFNRKTKTYSMNINIKFESIGYKFKWLRVKYGHVVQRAQSFGFEMYEFWGSRGQCAEQSYNTTMLTWFLIAQQTAFLHSHIHYITRSNQKVGIACVN